MGTNVPVCAMEGLGDCTKRCGELRARGGVEGVRRKEWRRSCWIAKTNFTKSTLEALEGKIFSSEYELGHFSSFHFKLRRVATLQQFQVILKP